MWRRAYVLLALLRLYFALSPSYLHPDEHFQGPEVLAGRIFQQPVHETWEFSSTTPVRSIFPLWIAYGMPMLLLRALRAEVSPGIVFKTLRLVMFCLSFVLEDRALRELAPSRTQFKVTALLVASSYVTWTWQVHTFSNAIETLVVLWSLVLIRRIELSAKESRPVSISLASSLSSLLVFGTFNRITFPAFVAIPLLRLVPTVTVRPATLMTMAVTGTASLFVAVASDTIFYVADDTAITHLLKSPIVTPINNLLYNANSANLALHGRHAFYQHFLVNLPQLLGPAIPLLLVAVWRPSMAMVSALFGIFILSMFPHQEARFLLPAVPMILSSVTLPKSHTRLWIAAWVLFNSILGVLMGVYHQGGIVPAQLHIGLLQQTTPTKVFWWKTYDPPEWLLGRQISVVQTVPLMGLPEQRLVQTMCNGHDSSESIFLVAPDAVLFLDQYKGDGSASMRLSEIWRHPRHINLDDLEFGDDGVLPTLGRVVGRRGLVAWEVTCKYQMW